MAENVAYCPPPYHPLHLTFSGRTELALCVAKRRVILFARMLATLPSAPPDPRLVLRQWVRMCDACLESSCGSHLSSQSCSALPETLAFQSALHGRDKANDLTIGSACIDTTFPR